MTEQPDYSGLFGNMAESPTPPEPPPSAASGPSLEAYLDQVSGFIDRFVVMGEHERTAVVLWVAHTFVLDRIDASPILHISSPEKRSGKSRLMDCLQALLPVHEYLITPSDATIYTVLDMEPRPVLLLDEVDAIFGRKDSDKYEGLRAILNAGTRRKATVPRVEFVGNKRTVRRFPTYAAKALAGIGDIPDTVADRSIPIGMRRRAPKDRTVERWSERKHPDQGAAIKLPLWAPIGREVSMLIDAGIPVLATSNDRANDAWEPLRAIARVAGGAWPLAADDAANHLIHDDADDDLSRGVELLRDCRAVFDCRTWIQSGELKDGLNELEESPWGDMRNGLGITPRYLASHLRGYGIKPKQERIDGIVRRGYYADDFADAWSRYAPDV